MNQKKKVFISFLGVSTYRESKYYFKKDRSDIFGETPYVQEAIIRQWPFAENALNQEGAEVLIFTTKAAYEKTYTQRITSFANRERNTPDKFEEDGLEFKLQKLVEEGLIQNFAHREIQDGFSEDEIWSIFDVIVNNIEEGTELYFDVTYGYRFLPLLTLSLINYLAAVKNCELKALFYGNFEAGQAENEAKGLGRTALVTAPIHILTNIVELNQWTDAVEMFTKASYPYELSALIAKENEELAEKIKDIAMAIQTCRGHQLTQEIDVAEVKRSINDLLRGSEISTQLKRVLEKVDEKLDLLNGSTTLKGLNAVEWCVEHKMIQQGYTFLQETLQSWLLEKVGEDINNYPKRQVANGFLNGYGLEGDNNYASIPNHRRRKRRLGLINDYDTDQVKDLIEKFKAVITDNILHDVCAQYTKLTGGGGLRNDINHAGYQQHPATPEEFATELVDISNKLLALLGINIQIQAPTYLSVHN